MRLSLVGSEMWIRDSVYVELNPVEEVVIEETSIDEFPHIQPITVTATRRPID